MSKLNLAKKIILNKGFVFQDHILNNGNYKIIWICQLGHNNSTAIQNFTEKTTCKSCPRPSKSKPTKGLKKLGRPQLNVSVGQAKGALEVLELLPPRKGHSYVKVKNIANGVEKDIPTADFLRGRQKLWTQKELNNIYALNAAKSSSSIKGSKNPKNAIHTWQKIYDMCKVVGFVPINLPMPSEEKVFDCVSGIWKFKCHCGSEFSPTLNNIMCGITTSCGCVKSKAEVEIGAWLDSLGISFLRRDKKQLAHKEDARKSLELDFFLPDYSIAIEHNGIAVHGEKWQTKGKGVEWARKHALWKHQKCQEKGIRLITIFGDEWILKKDQVKGYLSAILGKKSQTIGARKCAVIKYGAKNLSEKWHLQGSSNGTELALEYQGQVVAGAIFGKKNASRGGGLDGEYELLRYCVVPGISVPGGLSKLIKIFVTNTNDCKQITSYSDNRWSDGQLYKSTGFIKASEGPQSYWYFKDHVEFPRIHRFTLRKQVLLKKFQADPLKTEWEIASANGYDRIWDLGAKKWVKYI